MAEMSVMKVICVQEELRIKYYVKQVLIRMKLDSQSVKIVLQDFIALMMIQPTFLIVLRDITVLNYPHDLMNSLALQVLMEQTLI